MKAMVYPEKVNDTLPKIISEMSESKSKVLKPWVERLKALTRNTTSFNTKEHGSPESMIKEVRQIMKERGINSVRLEIFIDWNRRGTQADYIVEVTLTGSRILFSKSKGY